MVLLESLVKTMSKGYIDLDSVVREFSSTLVEAYAEFESSERKVDDLKDYPTPESRAYLIEALRSSEEKDRRKLAAIEEEIARKSVEGPTDQEAKTAQQFVTAYERAIEQREDLVREPAKLREKYVEQTKWNLAAKRHNEKVSKAIRDIDEKVTAFDKSSSDDSERYEEAKKIVRAAEAKVDELYRQQVFATERRTRVAVTPSRIAELSLPVDKDARLREYLVSSTKKERVEKEICEAMLGVEPELLRGDVRKKFDQFVKELGQTGNVSMETRRGLEDTLSRMRDSHELTRRGSSTSISSDDISSVISAVSTPRSVLTPRGAAHKRVTTRGPGV